MPSKEVEHCIPDRWPCHLVRASPPWTTCSPRRGCSLIRYKRRAYLAQLLVVSGVVRTGDEVEGEQGERDRGWLQIVLSRRRWDEELSGNRTE